MNFFIRCDYSESQGGALVNYLVRSFTRCLIWQWVQIVKREFAPSTFSFNKNEVNGFFDGVKQMQNDWVCVYYCLKERDKDGCFWWKFIFLCCFFPPRHVLPCPYSLEFTLLKFIVPKCGSELNTNWWSRTRELWLLIGAVKCWCQIPIQC